MIDEEVLTHVVPVRSSCSAFVDGVNKERVYADEGK
jgi:hypothetical protein